MSKNGNIIQDIVTLHNMIVSQRKKQMNPEGLKQLNMFVSDLKSVGLIEGIALNGGKGRYFLFDGHSWNSACHRLGRSATPNFVAWEEADFFEFLKSQFVALGKSQADKKLTGKRR